MASNVVIDASTIASIQSSVASMQQFLTKGQYYYQRNNSTGTSVYPFVHSGVTNTMSVYQTTVVLKITAAKLGIQLVVPPNSFKDRPIVSAIVECAAAPGAMSVVLTNIETGSNAMSFDVYTNGTIPPTGVSATIHITAIAYE